jgi:hypothetical protein
VSQQVWPFPASGFQSLLLTQLRLSMQRRV